VNYSKEVVEHAEWWNRTHADEEPPETEDEACEAMIAAIHKMVIMGFDLPRLMSFVAANWEMAVYDAVQEVAELTYDMDTERARLAKRMAELRGEPAPVG